MSIEEISNKSKYVFIIVLTVLVGGISFGLGRLLTLEKDKTPISISSVDDRALKPGILQSTTIAKKAVPKIASSTEDYNGVMVASKTGTKYYFPWCGSAKKISAANKVYFATAAAARAAGLVPSSTCKGLR